MADGGMDIFDETLSMGDAGDPAVLRARGFALVERQRFHEAAEAFETVLKTDPNDVDALNGLGVIHFRHGALDRALSFLRAAANAAPGNATVAANLVTVTAGHADALIAQGRLDDAGGLLAQALDHVEAAPETRDALAMPFFSLSLGFQIAGRNDKALHAARIAAFLSPETPNMHNRLHHALLWAGAPSRLSDYSGQLTEEQLGKHVFIACFPKSGSTFLSASLQVLSGFPSVPMTYAYLQNEQELYLPYLLAAATQDKVTQQHCRATTANLHLMQGFGIRPIILVRNIFDVLLSWKEFVASGAHVNTFYPDAPELDDGTRMDLVIADRAAWYLSFFAGWRRATDAGTIDAFWLTYEDMVADKPATLRRIAAFYGLDADDAAITRAIEATDGTARTRFNKGVSGRGRSAFTDRQKERIADMARFHPGIDFSMIGL